MRWHSRCANGASRSASRFPVRVYFEGQPVGEYFADLNVAAAVIIELKAVEAINPAHEAQLLNYLRATDIEVGLVLNFGPKAEFRRKVFANERKNRTQMNADSADSRGSNPRESV
jgi:hypothetical protein